MARKREKNERQPYEARRWADGIIERNKLGPNASVNQISGVLDDEVQKNKQSLSKHGLFGRIVGEGYGLLESLALKNKSVDIISQRLQEKQKEMEQNEYVPGP